MLRYLVRRFAYAVPILIGVNLLTFALFFGVHSPDSIARTILGDKQVDAEMIARWKRERGYDLPRFWNSAERGIRRISRTIFWQTSVPLLRLQLGRSDIDRHSIGEAVLARMSPSLAITLPMFLISLVVTIAVAMLAAFHRGTAFDAVVLVGCVVLMSVSTLFYIIGGQFLFARVLKWFPFSGYVAGPGALRFLWMPVLIGVLAGLGGQIRFDRTVFLEEIHRDYIRTARAKGLGEGAVLFRHALKNAMIPILTSVVVTIPFLIMGNLLLENFFGIPGLGSYVMDAIQRQDFAVVRAMVYVGSLLYIAGLLMVDIAYVLVDPRVRLS
ncbi:MAG: ABC transporter permease [Kiritimatiellae bacterium]|nr:ABC transporter permease [Kiritimatiellia bacterium]